MDHSKWKTPLIHRDFNVVFFGLIAVMTASVALRIGGGFDYANIAWLFFSDEELRLHMGLFEKDFRTLEQFTDRENAFRYLRARFSMLVLFLVFGTMPSLVTVFRRFSQIRNKQIPGFLFPVACAIVVFAGLYMAFFKSNNFDLPGGEARKTEYPLYLYDMHIAKDYIVLYVGQFFLCVFLAAMLKKCSLHFFVFKRFLKRNLPRTLRR